MFDVFVNFYNAYLNMCNKKGESPSRVALNCGISKASVNRWKHGYQPTDANLQKLADYFGVTVDYLLGKERGNKKEPAKLDRFQSDYYSLDPEDRETVEALIKSLLSKAKYKKIDVG